MKKEEIKTITITRDIPIAECPSSVDKLFEAKDDKDKEVTWVIPASSRGFLALPDQEGGG